MLDQSTIDDLAERHAAEVSLWTRAVADASNTDGGTLDRYMESVVARRTTPLDMSPLFEAWLLESVDWEINGSVLGDAVSAAGRMIAPGTNP